MTLLEEAMPMFDVRSRHETMVRASPSLTYRTLVATDVSRVPVVHLLMSLRTLPLRWADRKLPADCRPGFVKLAELPDRELVLGITGKFWSLEPKMVKTDPATFRDPIPTGFARAAWNFALEPMPDGLTRLTTETRVQCADDATGRKFKRYWLLVAPFSGLIRRGILQRVRRVAEETARDTGRFAAKDGTIGL